MKNTLAKRNEDVFAIFTFLKNRIALHVATLGVFGGNGIVLKKAYLTRLVSS